MLLKPLECSGCSLAKEGSGYAPPEGPENADLCFVGESLGATEAALGRPFVGDAGGMLQRLLGMLGWARESIRIGNTLSCRPPNDWLDPRAPWFHTSINHCDVHRQTFLNEPHKVYVALGGVATRTLLGLHGVKAIQMEEFHGTVHQDAAGRIIVPTFHPSFLQRGATNLIGTVLWDLLKAREVAEQGIQPDPGTLIIDPPIDWFTSWVDTVMAATAQDPLAYPITVDIETPEKATGKSEAELSPKDDSYTILRVNVACHPDEGITVPATGPYLDQLKRLLSSSIMWLWYKGFDLPRLIAAGLLQPEAERRAIDLMNLAHFLQSDLPLGLGFWAPFYSTWGAWKHIASAEPAKYAAIDALQNHRCGFGIVADLQKTGQYAAALRHQHLLHYAVLKPAQDVGLKVDRERLLAFKVDLTEKASQRIDLLQDCYPGEITPLTPTGGLTSPPSADVLHARASAFTRKGKPKKGKPPDELKMDLYKRARVVEQQVIKDVLVCTSCGEIEVGRKHRCQVSYQKKDGTIGWKPSTHAAEIELQVRSVARWFWSEPFNPDSWPQVLAYIKHRGHTPGRAKKTGKDTTDRETLERLEKTGDPFYRALLDYRAINKIKGTYVDGTFRRLDDEDRVHPTPTFRPSTHRLSYVDPNITNVVADKDEKRNLASGFRNCIVAGPGCRLAEFDFSAIEAVVTGERARDPDYIRLAKLGVHAGLASHVLGRPYKPEWSDADKKAYFKEIKSSHSMIYDRAKRFIHGRSYGLTIEGMVLQFPEMFPSHTIARQYDATWRRMAPKVPAWQHQIQEIAAKQHYLGGTDHPYRYKHWFWSIYTFKKITTGQYYRLLDKAKKAGQDEDDLPITVINGQRFRIGFGEDSKRALAFFPQSIAAGILKEAMLRLFDPESPAFIGDAYFGRTPLRAPIHDSLLLEIPDAQWDRVCEKVFTEMMRPVSALPLPAEWNLGSHLTIGVAAKAGADWGHMEDIPVPGLSDLSIASDVVWAPDESDEEDAWGLNRIIVAA